ncbi:hypothetical protein F4809DRAFT_612036 [Biscogniauxia mediterranea]|nr:hypothetical protein F4809DRAFT_612036 [Biscogniauxia mediterranea]
MTKSEPLTSLALGRSPYDGVEPGEGEPDPHEPEKQYDDAGRIVNPETKRIIKDVIRAHNEVMLVIGVAEPENGTNTAEAEFSRQYTEYESDTGRSLHFFGRALIITGIWGVHGIRQRILVYREHASLSFLELLHTECTTHSLMRLGFAGLPAFIAVQSLRWSSKSTKRARDTIWFRGALAYIRFHLQLFVAMQRLDLIPASRWLPGLGFFIPFSASSPFTAPPLPESLDVPSISRWVGKLALNIAPYATYYAFGCAWESISVPIRQRVQRYLPKPSSPQSTSRASLPASTTRRQTTPESPTLGAADREIRHTPNPDVDVPTSLALDGQTNGEPIPVGIRRQSTLSSRGGDEYVTDEEDSELVNPTLISFDVDTSESTEPPSGIWSAELRPSFNGETRPQQKEAPKYVVNPLTSLPSLLAGEVITSSITQILLAPLDALAYRAVGRAFARKMGLPYDHMFEVNILDSLSWRGTLNFAFMEMARFIVSSELWVFTTVLSQWLHVTEEEWKEIHREEGETTGETP